MIEGEAHDVQERGIKVKAFMTNGTISFLKGFEKKHPDVNFYFMSGKGGGLAYYEEEKTIFTSGRGFDILIANGKLQQEGYVVMNNIPATSENKYILEDNFNKWDNTIEHMPGFQAFRFLRPLKGDTYVVLTQWRSSEDFDQWKQTEQFQELTKIQEIKKSAYFPSRPFTSTYHMYEEK